MNYANEIPDGEEFPELRHADGWQNYGDVNPRPHGGMWVRWDADAEKWDVVHTRPVADYDPDAEYPEDGHRFESTDVYPDDLFTGGDPENGPEPALERVLDALGHDYLSALVGRDVEYYVADAPSHARLDPQVTTVPDTEYWDALESHGVDTDEYRD